MSLIRDVDPKYLELIELDANENIVCAIKKHPVGLVGVYITGLFVFIAILVSSIFGGVWINDQSNFGTEFPVGMLIAIFGAVVGLLVLFFTYVAGYIYQNNIIIITNDKVAQIIYRNLVDRKISQLSLGEVQDVTVDQRGLLSRMFKYGTLLIETAGEQNNFLFTYTPYPYECAKEIVGAREDSIKKYGN